MGIFTEHRRYPEASKWCKEAADFAAIATIENRRNSLSLNEHFELSMFLLSDRNDITKAVA